MGLNGWCGRGIGLLIASSWKHVGPAQRPPSLCTLILNAQRSTVPSLACCSGLGASDLTGTLPPSWASGFPALRRLAITGLWEAPEGPRLSGSIPDSWSQPGAFKSLKWLDLSWTRLTDQSAEAGCGNAWEGEGVRWG